VVLDAALRKRGIDGVDENLTELYIDAEFAKQMVAALQAHEKAGDYKATTEGDAFAEQLTKKATLNCVLLFTSNRLYYRRSCNDGRSRCAPSANHSSGKADHLRYS
jgi:hypothetical protein